MALFLDLVMVGLEDLVVLVPVAIDSTLAEDLEAVRQAQEGLLHLAVVEGVAAEAQEAPVQVVARMKVPAKLRFTPRISSIVIFSASPAADLH